LSGHLAVNLFKRADLHLPRLWIL